MLIFCWPFPLLEKTDFTTFKVNMTNHSQDILHMQFQRQMKVPSHKQTLLCNTYIEEQYFTFFLEET